MTDHDSVHGATAADRTATPDRQQRRRFLIGGLIGAFAITIVSAIFITAFIGGLHAPGPRSVPLGVVGPPALATRVSTALDHQVPGAFDVSRYPSVAAARNAISDRTVDAALVPGPAIEHLLVASAVSEAQTNATVKIFSAGAAKAHVPLKVLNIRPLHSGDPEGLAQLFFVIALTAPSLAFGFQLINRIGRNLNEFWHIGIIIAYAAIVSATATAIADAGIGALTGSPWAIFGVGALIAFAVAVVSAAAMRWTGSLGYILILLLLVPVGISSSGSTLGPHMITPWYSDLGKALTVGPGQTAVRNVTYFNSHAVITPLLTLSAWALAGIIALTLAAFLHPPIPGQSSQQPAAPGGAATSAGAQGARVV